ncbi:hypothetical protein QZH41_016439 [Actinostola sp. cb2023]|nr:hypothetical protein QZH41_016439 [Actinostola sp. cb2023]
MGINGKEINEHHTQCASESPTVSYDSIINEEVSRALSRVSRGTQEPCLPVRPYREAMERTRRTMRAEVIDTIQSCALKFVHYESGPPLAEFMGDVVESKAWTLAFGNPFPEEKTCSDFIHTLAEEYKRCKDIETIKEVKATAKKQQQKLLVGNTKAKSRISLSGSQDETMKTRTEAARKIGQVRHYGDEKRRLLSIVALNYKYRFLQAIFGCSPSTITAARVHCILFGRGGVPPPNFKFVRQRVSPTIIQDLTEFLYRDDISRASSCRSVMVDGEETGIRYWQDSVKNVVQQYLMQYPNGVKRTYIYTHLPKNFRMNTMLAGLCNICDDCGHSNFDAMCNLVNDVGNLEGTTGINTGEIENNLRKYQSFLKKKFMKVVERHSDSIELCMANSFGVCRQDHGSNCIDMNALHEVVQLLSLALQHCTNSTTREKLALKLNEMVNTHWEYVGHLLRTKHQGDYYQYVLKNLKPGECVVVVDYKMKLELGKKIRENQRDWYGKRGLSLHGCYILSQLSETERSAEVIDLWSEDTKQDAWFSQSALDVCFTWLEGELPGFRVYLFSDNGPHYHNTAFLLYLAEVNEAFNLHLVEYNNFEAGEGKTVLDTHFAHISHKIVRWVRLGNNFETGQLADLIGVSVQIL